MVKWVVGGGAALIYRHQYRLRCHHKQALFVPGLVVILNNQLKPEDVPDLLQHKYTNRGTRKAMHHPPLILIGVAPGDLLLEQLFGVVV